MVRRASYEKPKDGPQSVRHVGGTFPGVLDLTQPSRILQTQASVLSFASYEPRTATSEQIPDFGNLSLDDNHSERCRPKRIVIETIPGRGNFWRFVPNAIREQYVEDEGAFPRLIKICGQLCECSQEQWDIYKLDPKYECCVKAFPALSVINIKPEPATTLPFRHTNNRRTISPSSTPKPQPESLRSTPLQSDIDEGERMIIDDDNNYNAPRLPRSRKLPQTTRNLNFDFAANSIPSQPKPKRKADISFQSLRPPEEEENIYFEEDARNRNTKTYAPKIKKRARTLSPSSQIRELEARRTERARKKRERREQEKEFRRQQSERRFMNEVLSEVPQAHFHNNEYQDFPDIREEDAFTEENSQDTKNTNHHSAEVDVEDAADHAARIAESLQKMADLEADRPLWEAAKKKREARERAQEEQLRAKSEARKAQQKQSGERREARHRQEQDQNRRHQEANYRDRERLDRERQARYDQWNSGAWTTYRALERYRLVCQYFDETKFSETYPLTFHDIPWPTLRSPIRNSPQDMTWEAVQGFFMVAKTIIRDQAYRDFLKSSVSRFHTDRWRSRKLLQSVVNVEERDCIEVAVDAVGKSLGNLWDEWKSSN